MNTTLATTAKPYQAITSNKLSQNLFGLSPATFSSYLRHRCQ